jgi:hypothetical protein
MELQLKKDLGTDPEKTLKRPWTDHGQKYHYRRNSAGKTKNVKAKQKT